VERLGVYRMNDGDGTGGIGSDFVQRGSGRTEMNSTESGIL